MNENIYEKLKEIKIEDFAFLMLIVAVLIDLSGNDDLKRYYTSASGKEDARKKFILASLVIVCVFAYFAYKNYKRLNKLDPNSEEYKWLHIRFIGSLFVVIGESLVLIYFINTPSLNENGY